MTAHNALLIKHNTISPLALQRLLAATQHAYAYRIDLIEIFSISILSAAVVDLIRMFNIPKVM